MRAARILLGDEMNDRRLHNLKSAVDAGFYRTEAAVAHQERFPWQNAHCRDCPFWMCDRCQVDLQICSGDNSPCAYYNPPDFFEAKEKIHQRLRLSYRKRWRG